MVVWPRVSGLSTEFVAFGSVTVMPCCRRGATSIMIMRSTSMTSTSGVTLISDLTPPLAPPRSIPIGKSPIDSRAYGQRGAGRGVPRRHPTRIRALLRGLTDKEVDELGGRVVHLDVEIFDASGQVVVEP